MRKVSIKALARIKLPATKVDALRDRILSRSYHVELVLVGEKRSQQLNFAYRKKDYPTNILSFPLSPTEGQLVLNLFRSRAEAKKQLVSFKEYVTYLLVHGLLHLRGMHHGKAMEAEEVQQLRSLVSASFLSWHIQSP